jgi:hypothetical protein
MPHRYIRMELTTHGHRKNSDNCSALYWKPAHGLEQQASRILFAAVAGWELNPRTWCEVLFFICSHAFTCLEICSFYYWIIIVFYISCIICFSLCNHLTSLTFVYLEIRLYFLFCSYYSLWFIIHIFGFSSQAFVSAKPRRERLEDWKPSHCFHWQSVDGFQASMPFAASSALQ